MSWLGRQAQRFGLAAQDNQSNCDEETEEPLLRYSSWASKLAHAARATADESVAPVVKLAAQSQMGSAVANAEKSKSGNDSMNNTMRDSGLPAQSAQQLAAQRTAMAQAVAHLKELGDLLDVDAYTDVDYCGKAGRKSSNQQQAGATRWFGRSATQQGTLSLHTQERSLEVVRTSLLHTWRVLLGALQQRLVESRQADALQFYRCVLRIMTRREFDPTILRINVHGRLTCDDADLAVARRYRALLYLTQMFANKSLVASVENPELLGRLPHLFAFCAKVLAVNFFRIPVVATQIGSAVALSDEATANFFERLEREFQCTLPARLMEAAPSGNTANGTAGRQRDNTAATPLAAKQRGKIQGRGVMVSSYPTLFGWQRFHNALIEHGQRPPDQREMTQQLPGGMRVASSVPLGLVTEERDCGLKTTEGWEPYVRGQNKKWMSALQQRGALFFIFLRHWVEVVLTALPGGQAAASEGDTAVDWDSVPGYKLFLTAFVHDMLECAPNFDRSLLDCCAAMLRTDSALVTVYTSILLRKTSVYQFNQVTETLVILGCWFEAACLAERDGVGVVTSTLAARVKRTLPVSFDTTLFCDAMRIIINSDQHQLLARVLSFLYRWADAFGTTSQREAVFLHFLLGNDMFFHLFLHWDPSIRNTFVQLIVFRSLAHGRTALHRRGFIQSSELAMVEHEIDCPAPPHERERSEHVQVDQLMGPNLELKADIEICGRMDELHKAVQAQLRLSARTRPPKYSERELLMLANGKLKNRPASELENLKAAAAATISQSSSALTAHTSEDAKAEPQLTYPRRLEPYAPHALVEFVQYLSRYHQWEREPDPKPAPPLVPLHLLETREDVPYHQS